MFCLLLNTVSKLLFCPYKNHIFPNSYATPYISPPEKISQRLHAQPRNIPAETPTKRIKNKGWSFLISSPSPAPFLFCFYEAGREDLRYMFPAVHLIVVSAPMPIRRPGKEIPLSGQPQFAPPTLCQRHRAQAWLKKKSYVLIAPKLLKETSVFIYCIIVNFLFIFNKIIAKFNYFVKYTKN